MITLTHGVSTKMREVGQNRRAAWPWLDPWIFRIASEAHRRHTTTVSYSFAYLGPAHISVDSSMIASLSKAVFRYPCQFVMSIIVNWRTIKLSNNMTAQCGYCYGHSYCHYKLSILGCVPRDNPSDHNNDPWLWTKAVKTYFHIQYSLK